MDHREYIQQQSSRNMEFHLESLESLQKEANTTLTFLYVVISASFSAAVKLFIGPGSIVLAISLALLCFYLACLAAYLVLRCLMARNVEAPSNEPKNLKIPARYTAEAIQDFELENLQKKIDINRHRNEKTAFHLNLVRILICASPIVFIIAIAVCLAMSGLCSAS